MNINSTQEESETLYESLQREFCPPLDSSLLAVFLAEIEYDAYGNPTQPSDQQVQDLRSNLQLLAAQADMDETRIPEDFGALTFNSSSVNTDEGSVYAGDTHAMSSTTSDSSASSEHSFSSPLGFLQAALPHIPTGVLKRALKDMGGNDEDDVDMEAVVEALLTGEYIRELEERGLDEIDDPQETVEWETVERRKRPEPRAPKRKKGKTIPLVDIRQKQHTRPLARNNSQASSSHGATAFDPWTQISSLATHLAVLLPPHPPNFFQPFFHAPQNPTPYNAVRNALNSIARSTHEPQYTDTLFSILDILIPSCEPLNDEQRSSLTSDTQLALAATGGRGEDALDLARLLHELRADSADGYQEMGVYHVPSSPALSPASPSLRQIKLPAGPPPIQPPKSRNRSSSRSPSPSPTNKKSPYAWQSVPVRKHLPVTQPLSGNSPAYKARMAKLSRSERDVCNRIQESFRKRDELLRQASKAWKGGNAKSRGGEIAQYYAERARDFQELARKEALNVARNMVESKRLSSGEPDTLDLHGLSVAESVTVVTEHLQAHGASSQKPLKIITGRGTHSVNQIGVLKPAVRGALMRDGWDVRMWDGGLLVRGKSG